MSRKAVDPIEKILDLYAELSGEERRAAMAAMKIFGGVLVAPKEKVAREKRDVEVAEKPGKPGLA